MPQKSLISICDQQVSLPLLYFNSVCEFRGPTAGGIHQDLRPDFRTVGQPDSAVSDLRNRTTDKLRPALLESELAKQVRDNPDLPVRPVVFLAGGAPYALTTLMPMLV